MEKIVKFLSSGFYIGYSPYAPGTLGSLFALIIYLFFTPQFIGGRGYWVFLLIFVSLAIVLSDLGEKYFAEKDCQYIVIDEMAGLFITLAYLPKQWGYILVGVILYRFLDIKKLKFIKRIEKISGGLGIVLDDIVVGIMVNLFLQIMNWIF